MSIAAFFGTIGTFLTSPVITGISNVASMANLGVGIATKVDTHDMKSDIRSMKSDIQTLGTDICALTADIADFRKESMWNIQNMGGNPVRVNGSTVQYVQLQNPQTAPVQQTPQVQVSPVQQAAPVTNVAPSAPVTATPPATTVVNNVAAPAPASGNDDAEMQAFMAMISATVGDAVRSGIAAGISAIQTPPAPAPAPAPGEGDK